MAAVAIRCSALRIIPFIHGSQTCVWVVCRWGKIHDKVSLINVVQAFLLTRRDESSRIKAKSI